MKRPDWDEYFLKVAMLVAERSTCRRHHVGAVLVRNKRILSTGYNGAPSGIKDCLELGCLRDELKIPSGTRHEICRAVHAEQNAIIHAGLHGTRMEKATMYCTHFPCMICAKMIVNSKIKKIIVYAEYPDKMSLSFLKKAGIIIKKIKKPSSEINSLD
jgi:dCMP deaminase